MLSILHSCCILLLCSGDARGTCEILTDELSKRFEENMRQQEEITYLLAQLVDLQQKVKKVSDLYFVSKFLFHQNGCSIHLVYQLHVYEALWRVIITTAWFWDWRVLNFCCESGNSCSFRFKWILQKLCYMKK